MAIRVVVKRHPQDGSILTEELHPKGVNYSTNSGFLSVLSGFGQAAKDLATYAPGEWSSAHIVPEDAA